jgi:hypothetical protein
VFSAPEQPALAGFLAGYTGLTREAYATDLRRFTARFGTGSPDADHHRQGQQGRHQPAGATHPSEAIDLAIGERSEGAVFIAPDGRRLDRHGAARIFRRVARLAGIGKPIGSHTLRSVFITTSFDSASRSARSRKPPLGAARIAAGRRGRSGLCVGQPADTGWAIWA